MRQHYILFTILIAVFSFIVTSQPVFSRGGRAMSPYNKGTFTTIKGIVKSVELSFNPHTSEKGLHLTVKTSTVEYIVHVCPKWYAVQKKIKFKKGESVTISGSTFIKHNKKNIYAATITRPSFSPLKLRDPDTGRGLWKGRYKKKMQEKRRKKMRS